MNEAALFHCSMGKSKRKRTHGGDLTVSLPWLIKAERFGGVSGKHRLQHPCRQTQSAAHTITKPSVFCRVSPQEAQKWAESFDKLLSHRG